MPAKAQVGSGQEYWHDQSEMKYTVSIVDDKGVP